MNILIPMVSVQKIPSQRIFILIQLPQLTFPAQDGSAFRWLELANRDKANEACRWWGKSPVHVLGIVYEMSKSLEWRRVMRGPA